MKQLAGKREQSLTAISSPVPSSFERSQVLLNKIHELALENTNLEEEIHELALENMNLQEEISLLKKELNKEYDL